MGKLIQLPANTFKAKLFEVQHGELSFKLAGTLDGFIDLATPQGGTYVLSVEEARGLAIALNRAIDDVNINCLYGYDSLLKSPP